MKIPDILLGYREFLLAEDEGFEPPQTESESGVLPLHKSSVHQHGYYTHFFGIVKCKTEKTYLINPQPITFHFSIALTIPPSPVYAPLR